MHSTPKTIVDGFRDGQGCLIVTDDQGAQYRDVLPVRMFPITDPDGFLSICDRQGRELFCIRSMADVPAQLRPILQEELNRTMFTPVIRRIRSSVPFGDHVRLIITTDRGETDITVDTEEIYRLTGDRILLKDIHGIRFLIPDWHALNSHSRRILDIYL
jgi:hypothetical protein